MSTWTPEAQELADAFNKHCKPYEIQPTLKEQYLLVSRLTILSTERLDIGALLEPFWGLSWAQPHSWLWAPWRGLQSAIIDITCDRETLKKLEVRLKSIPVIQHIDLLSKPYVEKKARVMWKK